MSCCKTRASLRPSKKPEVAQVHGTNGMHPQVLRVDEITKPLPIIFEKLWHYGEVPTDGKRGNITQIFKKGRKENQGITGQSVSLLCLTRLWSYAEAVEIKELVCDSQLCGVNTGG